MIVNTTEVLKGFVSYLIKSQSEATNIEKQYFEQLDIIIELLPEMCMDVKAQAIGYMHGYLRAKDEFEGVF